jgi:hypothetical protein
MSILPAAPPTGAPTYPEIARDRITAWSQNPRQHFDEEKLQELADDIRVNGILQPLVVRPTSELCPDCKGEGTATQMVMHELSLTQAGLRVPCGACEGTGRVPTGRYLLVCGERLSHLR